MRQRSVRFPSSVVLLLLAAISGGCSGGEESAAPVPHEAGQAVPVTVGTVVRKTVPVQIEAVGKVEPFSTVEIRARVGGELTAVTFGEGQEVEKGQLLFTIDPRPFQAALDQAQAALARDRAVAANSAADLKRYGDLVQKEFVTREQYDKIAADVQSGEATVHADEAAVEAARLQLGYCSIRAPIAGRTGSLLVHAGNLVTANAADPLVVIHQIRPIYVSFAVPESQLPEITRRQKQERLAVTASPEEAGPLHRGELTFIDNQIDRTTGTIVLKATFPNEDRALWPGQFTKVRLTLSQQKGAIVAPVQAVQTGQAGQFVFVVRADQTVESRPVQVARTEGGDAVVSSGLTPGETVVTDGQLRLAPGVKIQAREGRQAEAQP
jgi:membrane fusion protein, multidrug efflux system